MKSIFKTAKNSILSILLTSYCILKDCILRNAYNVLPNAYSSVKGCLLIYCLLLTISATAQFFPVQVNQSIIPPYDTNLNSYATSTNVKLRLYLSLTDVNVSNRQVRLKLKINGQRIHIESNNFVAGAPLIFLNGGSQQQFTNIDLTPYFQFSNLTGINSRQYNQPLPDGSYKICWEVYDYLTNQRISDPNMGCSSIFLLLNDPPILNLPNRGDQLTDVQPTNIIFQWTPRHANATNVSYDFELRELWDNQIDPQAGFLVSPPYYSETTFSTTLLYNISKPQLIPGRSYAWRVRAKSTTGLSENAVFKNDGYSEIFYFTYTNKCFPPTFTLAEPLSKGKVKITWQTHPDHNKYHIQYKRADVADAEWFEVFSYNNQAQIANLQDGITYDFRVGGTCHELTDFNPAYTYSSINKFTTPTADETVSYSCGIVPEIEINNTTPLANIGVNETFTAGDFPITVKQIEGANGMFSGTGFIVVPYLADTKIAVTFSGIKINTDYQLFDGIIQTTYDPTWSSIDEIGDELEAIGEWIGTTKELITALFEDGNITKEQQQEFEEGVASIEAQQQEATELQSQAEELQQQAENAESPEKEELQQQSETLEEEAKDKTNQATQQQQELNQVLDEIKEAVGVDGSDNNTIATLRKDSFYDGVFDYGDANIEFKHTRLDNQETVVFSNQNSAGAEPPDELAYAFTHQGKVHRIIVTHSGSAPYVIEAAQNKVKFPNAGQMVMYFHYDTRNKEVGYIANFERTYFDSLSQEDYEEVAKLHSQALFNLMQEQQLSIGDIAKAFKDATIEVYDTFKEVLDKIKLPEELWDQYTFKNENFYLESLTAGLVDGILEEVKSIPLLLSLVVDYATDSATRSKINQAVLSINVEKIYKQFVDDRSDLYSSPNIDKIKHQTGKDIVEAGTLLGTGGIMVLGKIKKGTEFIEKIVEKAKKISNAGGLFKNFKNLKKLSTNAKAFLSKNNWDNSLLSKLDNDLVNSTLKDAFNTKPSLVNSWKVLENAKVDDAIRKNLDALNDPDAVLDAIQSIQKAKPTWAEIKALFKRGNDFNRKARFEYELNEIVLQGIGGKAGKRLDSYVPGKEIISRKATTLSSIQPNTFKNYLNELITKYPIGSILNSTKLPKGTKLSGDYLLEIPLSNKAFFESSAEFQKILKDFNKLKNVDIKIKYLVE